jgi:hypothetical protein
VKQRAVDDGGEAVVVAGEVADISNVDELRL